MYVPDPAMDRPNPDSLWFIGRDAQYLDAAVSFTSDLVKARMIINLFPESMKWFVSRFIRGPSKNLHKVMGLLMPVVHERVAQFKRREKKEPTDVPVRSPRATTAECPDSHSLFRMTCCSGFSTKLASARSRWTM